MSGSARVTRRAPARLGSAPPRGLLRSLSLVLALAVVPFVVSVVVLVLGPAPAAAQGEDAQGEDARGGGASAGSISDSPSEAPGTESDPLVGVTSGGSWRVEVRTEPAPIPLNEMFAIEVRVTSPDDTDRLVDGAVVTASSWMPDHNHGATLHPQVTSHGDGTARGIGFLFHMAGRWELRLGIAVDGSMERVALPVDLAP